jgi:CCR4-NOT transcription complex subunit 1
MGRRVNRLLDDLRVVIRRPPTAPITAESLLHPSSVKPETELLREKLHFWFQQWVNIFQRSHSPEKNFVPFINQLTKQGILKVEDVSSFYFRVGAESSVTNYAKCIAAGDFDHSFQSLDAMARLIVYIIKYHGDALRVDNNQAKVHYLTKILSIFVLVLANFHEEQGLAFQQKPFFRFFSSLINDLNSIEAQLGTAYFHLLIAIRYVHKITRMHDRSNTVITVIHSAPCSLRISRASRSLGCASFRTGCSCRGFCYPRIVR